MLLLNYSEMAPAQVVGTDILFGLVLAVIGSLTHWTFGSISTATLLQLLAGGLPGVVIGCLLARKVPAQKLKTVVAAVGMLAGLQLVWSGVHSFVPKSAVVETKWGTQLNRAVQP
jgi:uncharacterized membrane protein YfcA